MKKFKIIVFLLFCWSATSGQNIFPLPSGNVGIGTTTGLSRALTINGGIDILGEGTSGVGILMYRPVENGTGTPRWFLRASLADNGSYPYLTNRTPSGKVVIKTGSSAGGSENTHFTIEGGNGTVNSYFQNTNLGIGTASPTSPLTIQGLNNLSTADLQINSPNSIIKLGPNQSGPHGLIFGDTGNEGLQLFYRSTPNALIVEKASDGSDGVDLFFIDYDTEYGYFKGNVGIGTTTPQSKLSVAGEIRGTEVNVLANVNVPDYVFEPDYDLRTLKETKEYIKENKHLPEIPSAAEIGENGIDLGDMNMRLLKKIEEMTLYQIELMEELSEQKKEIIKMKQELQILKN